MKIWSRKSLGTSSSLERSEAVDEIARTEPDQLTLCIGSGCFSCSHVDYWGQSQ